MHASLHDQPVTRRVRFSVGGIAARRFWRLDSRALCAEAQYRTGLDDLGDSQVESRLSVLLDSAEREANLHPFGRFLLRTHLRELLETRLALVARWGASRVREAEQIHRPIFITGMPRSGSTFLHELLMQDTNSRAPQVWEVMFPLANAHAGDGQRHVRKAAARLWWFRRLAPGADSVHPLRATSPHECVAIHSHTLLSREFESILRVPGYTAFLDRTDPRPAYAWQKRFLQHLQAGGPGRQWVLKAPDHVFSLDALFAAFPDALVVQMHRNPLEVLKSCIRLMKVLRGMFAHPERPDQLGAREAHQLAEGMHRIMTFRDAHPQLANRFHDVNYRELIANPVGTIQQLYAKLQLPFTYRTGEQLNRLAHARARYSRQPVHPKHELPLDTRCEADRFESYCSKFGVV